MNAKEAAYHCLNPQTRFRELVPGDLFRFPGTDVVLEKTLTGYVNPTPGPLAGRTYHTGARAAVIRVVRHETVRENLLRGIRK